MLPASSAFAFSALATLAGISAGPGCQTRCNGNFDCYGGSYCNAASGRCETECFTDQDCREPPECQGNPSACVPKGLFCASDGRCEGPPVFKSTGLVRRAPKSGGPTSIEGWFDEPGTGKAFIVNQIALAGKDRGFDIDGQCNDEGCIDNILWRLGELANDQIRQGLLGGESLLLMEFAGLDDPYMGYDESLSVKIYGARDADEPFFPANNFTVPPGHSTCCEFKINPQSLMGPPHQARAIAPAQIVRGRLRSLAPVPIQFTLTVGVPPHPEVRLEQVIVSGRLGPALSEISDGLLGGAVPIQTLAQTENPYCKTVSPRCPIQFTDSTLIDLVSSMLGPEPDVDLDFDGKECVIDTDGDGAIDLCCDGRGATQDGCKILDCPGFEIPPSDPAKPWTCALRQGIDDGYSLAITFTAVPASIVGVGQ